MEYSFNVQDHQLALGLKVKFLVNCQYSSTELNATNLDPESPEFATLFDNAALASEIATKTQTEFLVQDNNRNATWQAIRRGTEEIDGKAAYDVTFQFTIQNATAEVLTSVQSNKTGEELEAELQIAAEVAMAQYYANRPNWTPII